MNAIAAVDRNWAIGREGGLLFHLPTDMKHFRDLTVGGTVILGRKTLETFPGGKPLKDRRNIVITRNSDFTRDGCDIVGCYDQALELTVDPEDDDVWVIGGAQVYRELLPCCRYAYVTRVAASRPADVFLADLEREPGWRLVKKGEPRQWEGLSFRFDLFENEAPREL